MAEEFAKEAEKAAFNEGIAQLQRINELHRMANYYSLTEELDNLFRTLTAVYRELVSEMNSDEEARIVDVISKCRVFYLNRKKGNRVNDFNYELMLEKLDCELRKIKKKHGLGMPSKDDPGMAMLGRM